MCGWAGLWETHTTGQECLAEHVLLMAHTLAHRGPDDSGVWTDPQAGFALGFRRLSIVDLSPEGHQPMVSESGRYVIAFNGEVYNFGELRAELELLHHRFRGHSDTEVILAAIEEWGLKAAVQRFIGMFGFALWDRQTRCLSLVRDRLGIKPLYYGWMDNTFLCGSELKALRANPAFRPEVNRDALALYLRYGSIPTPYSIYLGVRQVPPGCILTVPHVSARDAEPVPYWSVAEVARRGVTQPFEGSEKDAINHLDNLLAEAVGLRMIADVPLGAFLSGGIDSSTVVALMQAQSKMPVQTFSIGFHEPDYNEAEHAATVATHLGTDHTELYVTPAEAQAVIPQLPDVYDEPFADPSQIPTYLVSKLARTKVTVSLSGDGGDELFAGYHRYATANTWWGRISWMPPGLRTRMAASLTSVPPATYDRWLSWSNPLTNRFGHAATVGDKVHRVAEAMAEPSAEALYVRYLTRWENPESQIVVGASEPASPLAGSALWTELPNYVERMTYLDTVMYLPDDILTKVDRASMAVSLEARVPLLDHRVVEFAWTLPLSMKVRQGKGKWILRQVLNKYVPAELVERPKMGFGVPVGSWLCGPLRDWAESLLDERRLRAEGYLRPEPIRQKWEEHLAGRENWQYHLWDILMFQAWLERWQHLSPGVEPAQVVTG